MTDILITAVLATPILAGAGYLLRHYPRQTAIIATEGGMYAAVTAGYMAATFWLVPHDSPIWQQVLLVLSFTAVAIALAPVFTSRIIRRLNALDKTREPGAAPNARDTEHGGNA